MRRTAGRYLGTNVVLAVCLALPLGVALPAAGTAEVFKDTKHATLPGIDVLDSRPVGIAAPATSKSSKVHVSKGTGVTVHRGGESRSTEIHAGSSGHDTDIHVLRGRGGVSTFSGRHKPKRHAFVGGYGHHDPYYGYDRGYGRHAPYYGYDRGYGRKHAFGYGPRLKRGGGKPLLRQSLRRHPALLYDRFRHGHLGRSFYRRGSFGYSRYSGGFLR